MKMKKSEQLSEYMKNNLSKIDSIMADILQDTSIKRIRICNLPMEVDPAKKDPKSKFYDFNNFDIEITTNNTRSIEIPPSELSDCGEMKKLSEKEVTGLMEKYRDTLQVRYVGKRKQ